MALVCRATGFAPNFDSFDSLCFDYNNNTSVKEVFVSLKNFDDESQKNIEKKEESLIVA